MQVSRAAYMALYVWQDQAPLSAMCASDVKTCKTKNPLVVNYPGKILTCLTTKAGRNTTEDPHQPSKLSEDCATIYSIAQPPDSKDSFDSWFEVRASPTHSFCSFHQHKLSAMLRVVNKLKA